LSVIIIPIALGTQTGTGNINLDNVGSPIWSMSYNHIIQWLIFNAMYIVLVLYIINFASREERGGLLKTALLFFGAYIVARYVGFMTDLSGYLALSTLLIIGGIGLIALSIGYHKLWHAKRVN
jgi:hypothetical protein